MALALCGALGRHKSTYGVPVAMALPVLLLSFVAMVGNLSQAEDVDGFVHDNWNTIQQLIGPEYSYLPASTYVGDCQKALRVRGARFLLPSSPPPTTPPTHPVHALTPFCACSAVPSLPK